MKKLSLLTIIVLFVFVSCSKDDDKNELFVKNKNITLFHNEAINIEASNTNGSPITYTTEDELTATVDSKGIVRGELIGDTKVLVKNEDLTEMVFVTVKPKSKVFNENVAPIGSSKETVLNKHKGIKKIERKTNSSLMIVFFYEKYHIDYILKEGKVIGIGYATNILKYPNMATDVPLFMEERYIPVSSEEGYDESKYYFLTKDKKISVTMGLDKNDGTIIIAYFPLEKSNYNKITAFMHMAKNID